MAVVPLGRDATDPFLLVYRHDDERTAIVELVGEWCFAAEAAFRAAVARQRGDGAEGFVIDLRRATLLDVRMIHALLDLDGTLPGAPAVVVAGPSGVVERALVLTGAAARLTICQSRREAAALLDAGSESRKIAAL